MAGNDTGLVALSQAAYCIRVSSDSLYHTLKTRRHPTATTLATFSHTHSASLSNRPPPKSRVLRILLVAYNENAQLGHSLPYHPHRIMTLTNLHLMSFTKKEHARLTTRPLYQCILFPGPQIARLVPSNPNLPRILSLVGRGPGGYAPRTVVWGPKWLV